MSGRSVEPEMRAIQRELASATDDQVARVMAMIDELKVRGDADRLIAPLRRRLAELRPRRRLGFTRLLFLPLDPLVVDTARWRSGAPAVPRSALAPVAEQVRAAFGDEARRLAEVAAEHCAGDDIATLTDIGDELWPQAARALSGAQVPANWAAASGLRPEDHVALVTAMAVLLAQAVPLLRLVAKARDGNQPVADELRPLLAAVAPAGSQAFEMMIGMAIGWLPRSIELVRAADDFVAQEGDATLRRTTDRALDFVLSGIERAPLCEQDLAVAAQDARRIAAILADLDACSAQRPRRRARVEHTRRAADEACRARFVQDLAERVVAPSATLAGADDDTVTGLEMTARDLRRLEAAARRIGSPAEYDRQLQGAAEALRPPPGEDGAARISRVRLVEILRGPDAAVAMLEAGPVSAPGEPMANSLAR